MDIVSRLDGVKESGWSQLKDVIGFTLYHKCGIP